MLIIDQSSTYCGAVLCTASRLSLLPVLPPESRRKAGREQSLESLDPRWPKGYIPCHIMACSAIRTKWGELVWHVAIAQSSWAFSCLSEVLSDCLWITSSFLAYPFSLIKLLLSWPMNFLTFAFLAFLFTALHHWLGKLRDYVVLSCWLGSAHH